MECPTSHLYFLGIHTRLKARVNTKKIQVTWYTTRKRCVTMIYILFAIQHRLKIHISRVTQNSGFIDFEDFWFIVSKYRLK